MQIKTAWQNLFAHSTIQRFFMKLSNSTSISANSALSTATAAKKSTSGTYEKNAKEFGPVAASAIGLASGAAQSSSVASKVVNSIENGLKTAAGNTVELANEGAQEIKSAYNKVSSGIGTVASAAAGYAQTGISAGAQVINALV